MACVKRFVSESHERGESNRILQISGRKAQEKDKDKEDKEAKKCLLLRDQTLLW